MLLRALTAAIAAADARLRVTAVADIPLPATVAVVVAIRRRKADHRTAEDRHTVAAVAADMEGDTPLDSFPA